MLEIVSELVLNFSKSSLNESGFCSLETSIVPSVYFFLVFHEYYINLQNLFHFTLDMALDLLTIIG